MESDIRALVSNFFNSLGEEVDEAITSYVAGVFAEDIDETVSDLEELLVSTCPAFASRDSDVRLPELLTLHHKVQNCKLKHAAGGTSSKSSHTLTQGHVSCQPLLRHTSQAGNSKQATTADASSVEEHSKTESDRDGMPSCTDDRSAGSDQVDSDILDRLSDVCPCPISREYLNYLYVNQFDLNMEATAEFLLECTDLQQRNAAFTARLQQSKEDVEEAGRIKQLNRQHILSKFDLQVVREAPGKKAAIKQQLTAWTSDKPEEAPKVRYLDGVPVHVRKGEKYVVAAVKEEWDGGSRGKVYTKGKRGKGFA